MEENSPVELNFSEFSEHSNIPAHDQITFETHQPITFTKPYHHHASIELNYLENCSMTYSFSGREVTLQNRQLTIFWDARPHRVSKVEGLGIITNAYVSLSQFLQWRLPACFTNAILSGSVISTQENCVLDDLLVKDWQQEQFRNSNHWNEVHALDIQSRLKRLALDGWCELLTQQNKHPTEIKGAKAIYHFEKMLKFVSENFVDNISTQDIANQAGISSSYAIILFRKMLGRSIKEYLVDIRVIHAKMRLTNTNDKILTVALESGFGSLSSFYEIFHKNTGVSPARFRKNPVQS